MPGHPQLSTGAPLLIAGAPPGGPTWAIAIAIQLPSSTHCDMATTHTPSQAITVTAEEARQHADAEFKRLDRGTAQLSYRLAIGRADIYPEQTITVSGFKPEIDGTAWLVAKATHTIDGSGGFVTSLELERGG
jgi:phage protein D